VAIQRIWIFDFPIAPIKNSLIAHVIRAGSGPGAGVYRNYFSTRINLFYRPPGRLSASLGAQLLWRGKGDVVETAIRQIAVAVIGYFPRGGGQSLFHGVGGTAPHKH